MKRHSCNRCYNRYNNCYYDKFPDYESDLSKTELIAKFFANGASYYNLEESYYQSVKEYFRNKAGLKYGHFDNNEKNAVLAEIVTDKTETINNSLNINKVAKNDVFIPHKKRKYDLNNVIQPETKKVDPIVIDLTCESHPLIKSNTVIKFKVKPNIKHLMKQDQNTLFKVNNNGFYPNRLVNLVDYATYNNETIWYVDFIDEISNFKKSKPYEYEKNLIPV